MSEISTKPYLLRAIYEWCTDSGFTPHLAVRVDGSTRVPMEFVKNGEIVLNVSFGATSGLKMENDIIHFHARFGGISREISVPVNNVLAIYASENGQGMAFEVSLKPGFAGEPSAPEGEQVNNGNTVHKATPGKGLVSVSLKQETQDAAAPEPIPPADLPEPPKKGGRPTLTRIK